MKKQFLFLIILFLISFILRFVLACYSPIKYWDETIYTNLGRNLLIYKEYSFLHGFADFSPDWPLAGFRPPILPLIIAIISFFTFSPLALNFIIPILSSLGVVGLFFLVKELFDKEVAIYSSIIFLILPVNILWGSKLLTDTLFLTLIIFSTYFFYLSFFKGYRGEKNGFLFGIFAALAFLSRYAFVWFLPLFLLLILFKYKSLKFLKEKKLWISVISFLILVGPWFVFNYLKYGSWLGFLIQANQASLRWGTKEFLFYFIPFLKEFFILIPFFVIGLFNKNEKYKDSKIFMILWFLVIFFSASFMGNKEMRYLLPILPPLCALSSLGISYFKKYKKVIFFIVVFVLVISDLFLFKPIYYNFNSQEQICFFRTMDYIKNSNASYIVTEHFSPVYFYTLKDNIRVNNYTIIADLIKNNYKNKTVYYYYVNGDWFNLKNENKELEEVYSCENFRIFNLAV